MLVAFYVNCLKIFSNRKQAFSFLQIQWKFPPHTHTHTHTHILAIVTLLEFACSDQYVGWDEVAHRDRIRDFFQQ